MADEAAVAAFANELSERLLSLTEAILAMNAFCDVIQNRELLCRSEAYRAQCRH